MSNAELSLLLESYCSTATAEKNARIKLPGLPAGRNGVQASSLREYISMAVL